MKTTISFGKVDYYKNGRKNCLVTLEVELKDHQKGPVFMVSGNVWNHIMSDVLIGGQCLDEIWEEFKHELEKRPLYQRIMELWELYHLNNLNAGTPEQMKAVKEWGESTSQKNKGYKETCDYLKSIGLYEVEHEGKPYQYGSAWIYAPIPEKDLQEIKEIISNN